MGLFIKGFIMGIANIIPGVSGGTLALTLGIYEKFIHSISHFFKDFKNNIKFLIPVCLGLVISVLFASRIISWAYNKIPLTLTLFFIGLIIGGIPMLYKKIENKPQSIGNIITFILTFSLVIFMSLTPFIFEYQTIDFGNMSLLNYITLFIVGIIASATMVIPGISGSLMLMLLGYYYPIINLIKNIFNLKNIFILIIFGLGIVIGIVLISRLIELLFKKQEKNTYYGIIGFITSSILAIIITTVTSVKLTFNLLEMFLGIILSIIGFILSIKLGEK